MKKQQTVTGRIVKVECAGASYMGNPFWKITIDTADGYFRGKTTPNGCLSYAAENYYRRQVTATYHITKTGRIVIDDLEKNEQ